MKRPLLAIRVLALLGVLCSGCVAENLRKDMDGLEKEYALLKADDAHLCAPKEMASAEAYLEFAAEDLQKRLYISCADHLARLKKNVQSAKGYLEKCRSAARADKEKAPSSEPQSPDPEREKTAAP